MHSFAAEKARPPAAVTTRLVEPAIGGAIEVSSEGEALAEDWHVVYVAPEPCGPAVIDFTFRPVTPGPASALSGWNALHPDAAYPKTKTRHLTARHLRSRSMKPPPIAVRHAELPS